MDNQPHHPEIVAIVLRRLRAAVENDPQILLEGWGAGPTQLPDEYVFSDLFGFEDELLHEFLPMDRVLDVVRMPIPQRVSIRTLDTSVTPDIRIAEFRPLSGHARLGVDPSYLPGWRYDMQSFCVRLLYVRYKRSR